MGTNSKRRFRNTAVALGTLLSLHAPSSGAVTRAAVTRTAVAVSERPRRLAAISTAALLQRGVVMTEIDSTLAFRANDALALVRSPWQSILPGWQIVFKGSRKGYLAMTMRPERRIEVYLRSDRPTPGIAHDIAHELGHAIDVTYNTQESRATYLRLRGLAPGIDWWTCEACRDLDVPAGDFAETFAQWAGPTFHNYSNIGARLDPATLRTIAKAVFPGATADGEPGDF